jgi:hypothetical protein
LVFISSGDARLLLFERERQLLISLAGAAASVGPDKILMVSSKDNDRRIAQFYIGSLEQVTK